MWVYSIMFRHAIHSYRPTVSVYMHVTVDPFEEAQADAGQSLIDGILKEKSFCVMDDVHSFLKPCRHACLYSKYTYVVACDKLC